MRGPIILCSVCALIFAGCSSVKPPSTAPVHAAISTVSTKINSASSDATKIKNAVAAAVAAANNNDLETVKLQLSQAQSYIDSLTKALMEASKANVVADKKLVAFDQKNAAFEKRMSALEASRHRWVKFSWFSGLGLLSSALWIFRTPIFALLRIAAL